MINGPRQYQQRNPHQNMESWEILNHSCFMPLKFGVVCSTAKANWSRGPHVISKHLKDISTIYLHKDMEGQIWILEPFDIWCSSQRNEPLEEILKGGLGPSSREFWVVEGCWLGPTDSLTRAEAWPKGGKVGCSKWGAQGSGRSRGRTERFVMRVNRKTQYSDVAFLPPS